MSNLNELEKKGFVQYYKTNKKAKASEKETEAKELGYQVELLNQKEANQRMFYVMVKDSNSTSVAKDTTKAFDKMKEARKLWQEKVNFVKEHKIELPTKKKTKKNKKTGEITTKTIVDRSSKALDKVIAAFKANQ